MDPQTRNPAVSILKDLLFIGLLYSLFAAFFIPKLGFYNDDWPVLADLRLSSDQTLLGLFNAIYQDHVLMRPIQFLQFAGQYYFFGLNPFGHHVVNLIIIILGVCFFYLLLLELDLERPLALSICLIYLFLPHFSTTRFWVTTSMINLSMMMFFVSSYSEIRGLKSRGTLRWLWKIVAVIGLLISTLAYEIFIPLFCINVLIVGYLILRPKHPEKKSWKHFWSRDILIFQGINILLILSIGIFKSSVTVRSFSPDVIGNIMFFTKVILKSLYVSYGVYGLGLPYVISRITSAHLDLTFILLALIIGVLIFVYLKRITNQPMCEGTKQMSPLGIVGIGSAIFLLGYMIFFTTNQIIVTPTGIGNRTAIAASIGVAITQIGGIIWLSRRFERLLKRRHAQLIAITGLCVSGFLINGNLAFYWVEAYEQEKQILEDIIETFPKLEQGSTLVIDGICPYVGPAIVFDAWWDLAGALRLYYLDPSLEADIVTPNLTVRSDGMHVSMYWGGMKFVHPYDGLTIYNFEDKNSYEIFDERMAIDYFESNNIDFNSDCPPGSAGSGVSIY